MGDKDLTRAMAQMLEQMAENNRRRDEREEKRDERIEAENRRRDEQMAKLFEAITPTATAGAVAVTPSTVVSGALPSFTQFDHASELWGDYWCRFKTFFEAHMVSEERQAHVFLTNQSTLVYKTLANLSAQQTPPKAINKLTMGEIEEFMADQFNPQRFVVRERFRFWSKLDRKPGETIPELVARIRGDAGTCDFASIKDPQDEAMRTRFILSLHNEAALKTLFRVKDDQLTFAKAIEIAQGSEDAAAVAKETVYGNSKPSPVFQVDEGEPANVGKVGRRQASPPQQKSGQWQQTNCDRCGGNHRKETCRFKDVMCFHCRKMGHVASVCRDRQRGLPLQPPISEPNNNVRTIRTVWKTGSVSRVGQIRRISSLGRSANIGKGATFPFQHRGSITAGQAFVHRTSHHALTRRVGVAGRTNVFSTTADQSGGGASQKRRPDGAVGDWEKDRQPQQPQKCSECRQPLKNDDRPAKQTSAAKTNNPVATKRRTLTPAEEDEGASEPTSRVVSEPAASDERREFSEGESAVAFGSSTSVRERGSRRLEGKRRKNGRNRRRRRARRGEELSSLQKTTDRDFVGEGSSDVQKSIARRPPTTESADIGSRSVTRDDGVGAAVSSTLDLEPAELRCQSPGTMQERRQIGRGTDKDGSTKGKFAFSSIHCAVRQPSDGFSSVFAFRVARRDEDEQQPSDGVADEDPGRTMTCDESAPPQTEEVPSPSHVSPQGNDSVPTTAWAMQVRAAEHRHHHDRRNWFNWDTAEEANLVGPARQQRRRELEETEPPDISILFG